MSPAQLFCDTTLLPPQAAEKSPPRGNNKVAKEASFTSAARKGKISPKSRSKRGLEPRETSLVSDNDTAVKGNVPTVHYR